MKTGPNADPCTTSGTKNGVSYTADDAVTTSGVIVGHFIAYVGAPGSATGSGSCSLNSFAQCVEVITR
jgi:hypothetical protein